MIDSLIAWFPALAHAASRWPVFPGLLQALRKKIYKQMK
jgi:hypothetical protein